MSEWARSARAEPAARWKHHYCCLAHGRCTPLCLASAACLLAFPTAFALAVAPGLLHQHTIPPLVVLALPASLAALAFLCFFAVSCYDPGVAARPSTAPAAQLPHPGEDFSFSRETQRYVAGFDHHCDFVGNDIGDGNMPCFVAFLLSLTLLACTLGALCAWYTYEMATPPGDVLHWQLEGRGRLVALLVLLSLFGWCLLQCRRNASCSELWVLMRMMPGARLGLALLSAAVVGLSCLLLGTDIWDDVSQRSTPAAALLFVPYFAWAILFGSMTVHWVALSMEGVSQKSWLKTRGWTRSHVPIEGSTREVLV